MLKVPKPFASCSGASGGSATTGSGASRRPAAPPGPGASHQMAMEARAHLALIHAQWTPSGKRHISHLILQCFGVVFFCMRKRKKKIRQISGFCSSLLGKDFSVLTLIQALKHQQLQNGFSLRLRKVSPGKKAECGALQRLKTSDGGELAPLGAGPGTFGRREVWEVCCWGQGSRLLGMCHIA